MAIENLTELEIDKSLLHHIGEAMRLGCEAIHGREPLVPFSILWHNNGEQSLDRHRQGTYEDAIELVMKDVIDQREGVAIYAIMWEGYVSVGDEKLEAIIVEAGEKGRRKAVQVARPYMLDENSHAQLIGELMLLGETENLLDAKSVHMELGQHLLRPAFSTSENVVAQPFAQMVAAAICVSANEFEGQEQDRIETGLHLLQKLEQRRDSPMTHRVFAGLLSHIAEGDLMTVLPTDDLEGLIQLMIEGTSQLREAVNSGRVLDSEVAIYLDAVREIMTGIMTNNGQEELPAQAGVLLGLFGRVMPAAEHHHSAAA